MMAVPTHSVTKKAKQYKQCITMALKIIALI